ncbi:MAG: small subunit ribosomal protein S8 [Parcubacteria group bacterium Greene0714_21]|nr:MAG: small subunit ribosomal protein S8 [Parcubacteria group bacterium Greene0416_39]TSC97708.1 MAG: small subunit ribosomal protein S8 [Parcubacteria group bacterium Greene1014_47]TSD04369.1 MAG: small subunit ribosomal protein S8 [Parcubacteria group bacterium Greene0714_21]
MTDPIADMLTRIMNAQRVQKPFVEIPFSNLKFEIAKVLLKEGFLKEAEQKGRKERKVLELALQYDEKTPVISGIKKISKPGQRIYASRSELLKTKRAGGTLLVSTSKGIMTDKEARKSRMGGEVICEVW